MSSIVSLKDLVAKHYNILSIDGDDVKLSSTPASTCSLDGGVCGKKGDFDATELKSRRFGDYFDAVDEHVRSNPSNSLCVVEPPHLKRLRPFLLAHELVTSKVSGKMKRGKGKGKGKKGGRMKGGEIVKVYTFSNPPPKPMNFINTNRPYTITQEIASAVLFTSSTTLNVFTASNFTFGALDQASSLGAVFDQYRIDCIECWIEPTMSAPANNTGQLYTVVDYDDSTALTTIGQAADYSNVASGSANDCHYRRFVPHVAVATYSGTFTSYGNVASPWIDAASSSVQHYGLKTACTICATAGTFAIRIRYHVSLRNVR